jgi:hypothetical protein
MRLHHGEPGIVREEVPLPLARHVTVRPSIFNSPMLTVESSSDLYHGKRISRSKPLSVRVRPLSQLLWLQTSELSS